MRLFEMADSGNCYKVRLTAAHLGVALERIAVDVVGGETRRSEFLARNPNGRVPTLQLDDGTYLPESNAIICYLASGSPLLPADRLSAAQTLQWLFFEQYSHERFIATNRYWLHIMHAADTQAATIAANVAPGYAALGVMEGHLASRDWFAGNRFSVADIALYAYTHVADEGGFHLTDYPQVQRWLARVAAQPGHVGLHD